MMYRKVIFVVSLLTLVFASPLWAAGIDQERDQLIADYKSDQVSVKEVVQALKWSAIESAELFDQIEQDLLESYTNGKLVEDNSWRVQALAFSGQTKYRGTIHRFAKVTGSKKLRRHAKTSLEMLPDFAKWNVIIREGTEALAFDQLEPKRIKNMLQSQDYSLVRAAGSIILQADFDKAPYLPIIVERLKKDYKTATQRFPDADALAWLCKVLGQSGDKQYEELLTEISKNAESKVLKKWATRSRTQLLAEKADDGEE